MVRVQRNGYLYIVVRMYIGIVFLNIFRSWIFIFRNLFKGGGRKIEIYIYKDGQIMILILVCFFLINGINFKVYSREQYISYDLSI